MDWTKKKKVVTDEMRIKAFDAITLGCGYESTFEDDTCMHFTFKGRNVIYFYRTQWFTGKSVKDGHGLKNLVKQLNK